MTGHPTSIQFIQCRLGDSAVQQATRLCLLHDLTLHRQWITRVQRHGRQVESGQRQQGHDVLDRRFEVQHHLQRCVIPFR